MSHARVREWLARINEFHPHDIDLGLDRVVRVWTRLGRPRPAQRVVAIAGTNGKGTCAHFIEQCLRRCGLSVGLYVSPHLLHFNERIRVDGQVIDDAALCAAFEAVEAACGEDTLTFFEFTTLAALTFLAGRRLDVAVLEVGLGGRLDAVNVIDADVAVVTNIGLDHQEYLGDTREQIGVEKAGIFRAARPAVVGDPDPPHSLGACAEKVGALRHFRGDAFHCVGTATSFSVHGEGYALDDLPRPPGAPLAAFVAGIEALALLGRLPVRARIESVLADWSLPGRLQRVATAPEVVLDVAHNLQAADTLAQFLTTNHCGGQTRLVAGLLVDKPAEAFLRRLAPQADEWFLASLPGPRGQTARALARQARSVTVQPVHCSASVAGAMALATARSEPRDRIVVCGSFKVVGPALGWLGLY